MWLLALKFIGVAAGGLLTIIGGWASIVQLRDRYAKKKRQELSLWDPSVRRAAGTRHTLTIRNVVFALRYCPPGTFKMGSPTDELFRSESETQHSVMLTEGFWMAEFPVTQRAYEAIAGTNPSAFSSTGKRNQDVVGMDTSNFPVESVSWDDCQYFIAQLNASGCVPEGWEFRLPREAEWEYACRAGTRTPFFWGYSLNGEKACCRGSFPYGQAEKGPDLGRPTNVGLYGANPWSLCDMHGNVWEWCDDWHAPLDAEVQQDPTGPLTGVERVARGGSWRTYPRHCRAASRPSFPPEARSSRCGFRVVLARKSAAGDV